MSINRVIQCGNLTRDAELRRTQGDLAVLVFGLAVNERRRKPDSDEWVDVPNYIDCVMFGNRAEALEKFLVKGAKVAVDGHLRWSQWEAEDRTKRSKHELIVDELEFMAPRKEEPVEVEEFVD